MKNQNKKLEQEKRFIIKILKKCIAKELKKEKENQYALQSLHERC